jgi:transposase-like protein
VQARGGETGAGDRGASVAEAARDLGVHENVLRQWVKDWQVTRHRKTLAWKTPAEALDHYWAQIDKYRLATMR